MSLQQRDGLPNRWYMILLVSQVPIQCQFEALVLVDPSLLLNHLTLPMLPVGLLTVTVADGQTPATGIGSEFGTTVISYTSDLVTRLPVVMTLLLIVFQVYIH